MTRLSGLCDPEEILLAVVLDDGVAQAGDGEILGFDMDGESEFSSRLRRNGADAGHGDAFNQAFKPLRGQQGLKISHRGRTRKGDHVDGVLL